MKEEKKNISLQRTETTKEDEKKISLQLTMTTEEEKEKISLQLSMTTEEEKKNDSLQLTKTTEEEKEEFVKVTIEPFPETNFWTDPFRPCTSYYDQYTVRIGDHSVTTTYGHDERAVANWIHDIQRIYRKHRGRLIVGLRLDRRFKSNCSSFPRDQFHVLTLCIGSHCAVVPHHSELPKGLRDFELPKPFRDFLQNPKVSFVGIGIERDAQRLAQDGGICLGRAVDLRPMVEKKLGSTLRKAKIDRLAAALLGEAFSVKRPQNKTISDYCNWYIPPEQVKNACVDAFLASEMGKKLLL